MIEIKNQPETFWNVFTNTIIISNTMTLRKLVIKCPQKPREDLWKSRGTFTNTPEAWGDI